MNNVYSIPNIVKACLYKYQSSFQVGLRIMIWRLWKSRFSISGMKGRDWRGGLIWIVSFICSDSFKQKTRKTRQTKQRSSYTVELLQHRATRSLRA
jgi:hypothetical protein